MAIFKINGEVFKGIAVESLTRTFEVFDSENSFRGHDLNLHRDPLGTLFKYKLKFRANILNPNEYDRLFEILCSPKSYHILTFPYGQNEYTFKGYISGGSDSLYTIKNSVIVWQDLSIEFVASEPKLRLINGVVTGG